MANSLNDFWKLLVDSGLLAAAECEDLKSAFARVPGADQGNAKTLCDWLIERGMLTRYQARLLLAGRPGPFFFGNYRVYDRVESGRLKGLFRAAHRETGEPVLLYFFAGAATQDLRKWLPVEARSQLAIAVKHPHVNRVDALIQADGYKFLVIEGLEGKSLDELSQGKPLPLGDVCRYLRKAVTGLARLHNLNQIHADIRPDTLWLEHSGQLKLLYFPLSRDPFGPAAALNPSNADYLAPECVLPGGKSPDVLSDIYSIGCTAYYLLSGQVPYPGGDAADKARRHAGEACVPLDQLADLPSPVASFIVRMMAKNPQERPATAMQVADELSALTPAVGYSEEKTANGQPQPATTNGQTPAAKPREQAPAPPSAAAARPRARRVRRPIRERRLAGRRNQLPDRQMQLPSMAAPRRHGQPRSAPPPRRLPARDRLRRKSPHRRRPRVRRLQRPRMSRYPHRRPVGRLARNASSRWPRGNVDAASRSAAIGRRAAATASPWFCAAASGVHPPGGAGHGSSSGKCTSDGSAGHGNAGIRAAGVRATGLRATGVRGAGLRGASAASLCCAARSSAPGWRKPAARSLRQRGNQRARRRGSQTCNAFSHEGVRSCRRRPRQRGGLGNKRRDSARRQSAWASAP